ncbi:LmeA family phospholipid-binding protein [Pseudonocardia humida]|uniref:DUF2993 domain-containing protein n=1 Tax=Pseudonocardia humida TaxID=2800819 RepID=A0ABT1A884_9PSEU|nr:DUF2993 domain-containing protein [Pseudonocardia humida]MCO1659233.1 DUF2993 domain-containing protein [Pseudonocardia humida]
MRRLVIALLVLAGLLVAADFGSAALAESAVSRQMRSQLGLVDDPAVRINGFPFLTQAISGTYSSVDVDASRISVGKLQELSVSAQLRDVDAPLAMLLGSGPKTLEVGEAEGIVRVPADDLERLVPDVADLRIETLDANALEQAAEDSDDPALAELDPERSVRLVGTGTLPASLPVSLPGLSGGDEIEVTVIASLELSDGRIRTEPRDVQLGGAAQDLPNIPSALLSWFADKFEVPIDPGTLPLEVVPTDVRAVNGQLEVSGEASGLTLGPGSPLSAG